MNKAIYDAKRERDILDKGNKKMQVQTSIYMHAVFFEALFSLSRTYQSEQLFQDNEFTLKNEKKPLSNPLLYHLNGAV